MELVPGFADSAYEVYELPFSPEATALPVPPNAWTKKFFGLDADAVRRILIEDGSRIRHPSLKRFRDALFKYQPFALVHDNCHWSLAMQRYQAHCMRTIYLESPGDTKVLETILGAYAFPESELIEEFYTHFYGIADAPVECCPGGFMRPEKWELFESYGWEEQIEQFDPERKWARSLVIYQVGNGDSVLLNPSDGDTAWALLSTKPSGGPFVPLTPTFAKLLDTCVDLSAHISLLLDYYRWLELAHRASEFAISRATCKEELQEGLRPLGASDLGPSSGHAQEAQTRETRSVGVFGNHKPIGASLARLNRHPRKVGSHVRIIMRIFHNVSTLGMKTMLRTREDLFRRTDSCSRSRVRHFGALPPDSGVRE